VDKSMAMKTIQPTIMYSLTVSLNSLSSWYACPSPNNTYIIEVNRSDETTIVEGQKNKNEPNNPII
jgi:hypothetical protein